MTTTTIQMHRLVLAVLIAAGAVPVVPAAPAPGSELVDKAGNPAAAELPTLTAGRTPAKNKSGCR